MAKSREKPQGIQPWWLTDMTETCSACSQPYAYHTEIRCIVCDGPMCPICVQVTIELESSCPDCLECEDQREDVASEVRR